MATLLAMGQDGDTGQGGGPNRRERNKLRTRRAIEAAAFELFLSQGFDHTTAEQIADRAEVSLRTYFRYFPSKEQVVFSHGTGALDVLGDRVAAQPPELPAFDALRAAYAEFAVLQPYDDMQEHHQLVTVFLDSPSLRGRAGQMLRAWETAVSSGLERRGPSPDGIDAELVGAVLVAALRWATRRCMVDPALDLHAVVLDALDHLDERIPPPVGPSSRAGTVTTPTSRAKRPASKAKAAATKTATTKKTPTAKATTAGPSTPAPGATAPAGRTRAGAARR
jgi:AcrR family transcriptional regulator